MMLSAGSEIHVTKLRPDGGLDYQWDGVVVHLDSTGIVLQAEFNVDLVEREFATFRRGDLFFEFYYFDRWFNVFQVSAPDGTLKGWYGNLGLPATLDSERRELRYIDLALDIWANPDGSYIVLDEHDLQAILEERPDLRDGALRGRAALVELAELRRLPRWPDDA
jgi:uncharacterized protein